ncbi:MAG: hypothetical protein M3Y58_01000 [Chloroflexota bacterium]|nr:hypothetical protein [Chloroflexota bacterium]
MATYGVRKLVTMVVGGLMILMAFASAGSVGAAIPNRAFQVLGCDTGDYACYYHRLGGAPESNYCTSNVYTCTDGVPNTPPQYSTNVSPYCGDGGGVGCVNGSPLYASTTITPSDGTGLTTDVVVTSNFLNIGTNRAHVVSTP